MKQFILNLVDDSHGLSIDSVTSFIGEDLSGNFGIWPNHARFMTVLVFGLARFKRAEEAWQYLALPGGVLYFNENELTISTRHFLTNPDLERISLLLEEQLIAEEENLRATRESLLRMEQAILKRMLALQHKRAK